jgi:flavin-dependent dehydrogenase
MGSAPIDTRYPDVISHAIRRSEFDHFLLARSGACVRAATPLASLERRGERWVVNGEIETPVVVGAAGHFCPIARRLRGNDERLRPVVAKEAEFPARAATDVDGELPELFFCRDLQGYAWCVRKGDYLNIGIGRRDNGDFNAHVRDFVSFLQESGKAAEAGEVRWCGHAYLAAGTGRYPLTADGMLVVGDAAGLAYPESGEGIKPAVESGRLAGETLIAAGGRSDREALAPYAAAVRRRYPPLRPTPQRLAPVVAAIGRTLMQSRTFTRRVVIDRWFLRR